MQNLRRRTVWMIQNHYEQEEIILETCTVKMISLHLLFSGGVTAQFFGKPVVYFLLQVKLGLGLIQLFLTNIWWEGKDETSRICLAQSRFFQIESLRSFAFWRIWSYNILIAAMWNSNHIEKISYGFTGEAWKCLKGNVHLHLSQQWCWTCSCILRCDCQPHLSLSSRDYINSSK